MSGAKHTVHFILGVLVGCSGTVSSEVSLPIEGPTINVMHILFPWEPFPFTTVNRGNAAYQVQVVVDNESSWTVAFGESL